MQSDRDLLKQALEALEWEWGGEPLGTLTWNAITALRERLAQPEQEFTTHEEGEDGWSDWVCPDPKGYLMKCCDCGLVHETQFGVVRYKSEAEREDCEKVDDPNLQAVFRMRRSEEWTPDDTAYRPGGLAQPEQEPVAWLYRDSWGTMKLSQIMPPPVGAFPVYTTPPRREWAGLDRKEMLSIIDQQQAYKKTGLPMFYRDQCLDMLRAIEAKLKEKNGRVDSFLRRLLDPEDLGHAVSHEVRQKVRELL